MNLGVSYFNKCLVLLYLLAFAGFIQTANANALEATLKNAPSNDQIRYYRKGMSSGMQAYNEALILLALEKSRTWFGDYSIEYFEEKLTPQRARVETELNRAINVNIAGSWVGPYADRDKIFSFCHSHYQNLMGLRALIIRKEDLEAFSKITNLKSFKAFRLVQDKDWPDGGIIQDNGFEIIRFSGMDNLLRTLSNKRVDYLPVSVLEAGRLLSTYSEYKDLSISQDILIFYPHPGCVYVSKHTPQIADRLKKGLEIASNDGSLDALFTEFFGDTEKFLRSRKKLTFILQNPTLSQSENQIITEAFLELHGDYIQPYFVKLRE